MQMMDGLKTFSWSLVLVFLLLGLHKNAQVSCSTLFFHFASLWFLTFSPYTVLLSRYYCSIPYKPVQDALIVAQNLDLFWPFNVRAAILSRAFVPFRGWRHLEARWTSLRISRPRGISSSQCGWSLSIISRQWKLWRWSSGRSVVCILNLVCLRLHTQFLMKRFRKANETQIQLWFVDDVGDGRVSIASNVTGALLTATNCKPLCLIFQN